MLYILGKINNTIKVLFIVMDKCNTGPTMAAELKPFTGNPKCVMGEAGAIIKLDTGKSSP